MEAFVVQLVQKIFLYPKFKYLSGVFSAPNFQLKPEVTTDPSCHQFFRAIGIRFPGKDRIFFENCFFCLNLSVTENQNRFLQKRTKRFFRDFRKKFFLCSDPRLKKVIFNLFNLVCDQVTWSFGIGVCAINNWNEYSHVGHLHSG